MAKKKAPAKRQIGTKKDFQKQFAAAKGGAKKGSRGKIAKGGAAKGAIG